MFVVPHQTTHYENRIYAKNVDAKLKVFWPTEQQSEVTRYRDKENILRDFASRLQQTATMNLYHVTKFSPDLCFTVHYFYLKMSKKASR